MTTFSGLKPKTLGSEVLNHANLPRNQRRAALLLPFPPITTTRKTRVRTHTHQKFAARSLRSLAAPLLLLVFNLFEREKNFSFRDTYPCVLSRYKKKQQQQQQQHHHHHHCSFHFCFFLAACKPNQPLLTLVLQACMSPSLCSRQHGPNSERRVNSSLSLPL